MNRGGRRMKRRTPAEFSSDDKVNLRLNGVNETKNNV